MDNIFCSCCNYKFSVDEIYYDRFYICNNPNCYKILCSDCNDLNHVYLDDLSEINCNCDINNDDDDDDNVMSIDTNPLSNSDSEVDNNFIDHILADF